MITRPIIYFDNPVIAACDAQCDKAWGKKSRPLNQLSDNDDGYEWLADSELHDAPCGPGTYEGGHAKPMQRLERLNRWCVRECERCVIASPLEDFDLKDFSVRIKNIPADTTETK